MAALAEIFPGPDGRFSLDSVPPGMVIDLGDNSIWIAAPRRDSWRNLYRVSTVFRRADAAAQWMEIS